MSDVMTRKSAPRPKPDDPAQSKRFIDAARELGTDQRPEEFDRVFGTVAAKKPAQPPR